MNTAMKIWKLIACSDESRLNYDQFSLKFISLKRFLLEMFYLANFHWFSVVWTLIYHDLRHYVVKMLWTHEAQPSESATNFDHVMT